jgi:hypothetical protein
MTSKLKYDLNIQTKLRSDNVVSEEFYGKLFFGGRPDICDDNWNTFPEYDTALGPQWIFMLDK